jgi:hypothetical protein
MPGSCVFRVLETTAAKFVNTRRHIRTNYHNAPQSGDSTVVDPDQSFADTVFPNPPQGVIQVENGIKDSLFGAPDPKNLS